tara:strand:+ start:3734 stop:5176 length:1443 start_codon:yes stop_codon:yes gene_type:complete
MEEYTYNTPVNADIEKRTGELDYGKTQSAWDFDESAIPEFSLDRITMDHDDFKAEALVWPYQCGGGFDDKGSCWYWKWHSCLFISHCYPVPYPLPACETKITYKEPTVHVEIAPRAATSFIDPNIKLLRNIPENIKGWDVGGEDPVPSAHVYGISPLARYTSDLSLMASHTMTCDLAQKWDKFEYVQVFKVPLPSIKLFQEIPNSLIDLQNWNDEWFEGNQPLTITPSHPMTTLYMSEFPQNKPFWDPYALPNGITPSGESKDGFEQDRVDAYKYVLPYVSTPSDAPNGKLIVPMKVVPGTGEVIIGLYMNKCDAGEAEDGTNICIGDWGALFPRNGQTAIMDERYPLKKSVQLAWRAYDKVLEDSADTLDVLKIARGTSHYGVGYENTDFSIDYPFQTDRYKVGETPETWEKGYFGEETKAGGMLMTLWRETSCCARVCCPISGYNPGETYPWGGGGVLQAIWNIEVEEWKITEISDHK